MSKLYDLPLKVLWIWNCNEAEIATDFLLTEGGKKYQVKGSGIDAFISIGVLKTCTVDNLASTYPQSINRSVYIEDGSVLRNIWNFWKEESGEIRFNELVNQFNRYQDSLDTPLFTDKENIPGGIDLKPKQIFNLVFEMEALLEMKKAFQGEVPDDEKETLIKASCSGFTDDTISKIRKELKRKGVIE